MKCKMCLKEEQFCTCVGSEKKHQKYHSKMTGVPQEEEEQLEVPDEMIPQPKSAMVSPPKKDDHNFGVPSADDEEQKPGDVIMEDEEVPKKKGKFFGRK
jgi:hypothetical protein